jgi:MFS family permease
VTDAFLPIIYALVNVTHTVIAIPIGVVSDRIGKERGLIIGYGSFVATSLSMLLLPHNVSSAIVVSLAYGLYLGIVETVQRALVPEYTQDALRGTAYGIYYLVVGSAFFIANFLVGILWEFFGSSTAIFFSLTTSSIAMIGMIVFIRLK